MNSAEKNVFISYAREDKEVAQRLYHDLKRKGITPWLDEKNLLPGHNWKFEINQAIKKSAYFIALLSSNSLTKRGYVHKELKVALDILDEFPQSQIFVIPVRLDDCSPMDEKLQSLHFADLFPSYEKGLDKILRVILPQNDEMIHLRITTPDDKLFEATVPRHTLISQVIDDFLTQWQPVPDTIPRSQRYNLGLDTPGSGVLDPAKTLHHAVATEEPDFHIISEELDRDSAIGLVTENAQGQRFSTAVLLSTPVKRLAEAFLKDMPQGGQGTVVVELVGGTPGKERIRRLNLDASLYDEGVSDYAVLRIYYIEE